MQSEFESISATLRKEHEENVEQLKREMAASEEEYRKQTQIQSEKLRELQSDYDRKSSELQQLRPGLAGRQRRRQAEDRAGLNPRERSRERRHEGKRENPLFSAVDDPTCFSEHARAVPPSLPLANPEAETHEQQLSGRDRVKAGPPDSREKVTTRSHDHKSGDDWSETSGSVSSMQLEELAPPTSTSQTPNVRANLESVRVMLEQNQRTLLRVLAEEQSVRAREDETTQTGVGKEEKFEEHGEPVRGGTHDRRRTEERGRRERVKPKKRTSSKPPKAEKGNFPTGNIKSKLKEEVKALGELERKLHSSRQLLFSREQDLHNLHSQLSEDLTSDGEGSRAERQLSPRRFPPPAERRGSASETRDSDRTRTRAGRMSSIPRTPQTARPSLKQQYTASRCSVSDDRRERSREQRRKSEEGDARRSQIRGTPERRAREPASEHFGSEPSVSGSEGEMSESSGSESESPTPSENVSTTREDQLESQREMVKSLNSINRQLRQLTSHIRQGSPHPPALPPQQAPPPIHYPTTPPHIPTDRWADPVIPTPYLQSQHRRESRESSRTQPTTGPRHPFRHGRSGDRHVTTSSAHVYPGYSGEVRADWLHEFQTQFPHHHVPPLLRDFQQPWTIYCTTCSASNG
ncbi:hypothetical protein GBAR_LOCUS20761 [Geodia barretti]|nr:hypothetical protein GBAR_LOCUS20761 [Geodia barretti]